MFKSSPETKIYAKVRWIFIQNVNDFNVSGFPSISTMLIKRLLKSLKLLTPEMTDCHAIFIPYFTHLRREFFLKLECVHFFLIKWTRTPELKFHVVQLPKWRVSHLNSQSLFSFSSKYNYEIKYRGYILICLKKNFFEVLSKWM